MDSSESDSLYAAIDGKLAELVARLPERPSWCERWQRLAPESADEERLAVYQAIRDSGVLPVDAGFYLVSWQMDAMADRHAEATLAHLEDRLRAIEAAHGLEAGESWELSEAPVEYQEVQQEYEDACDEIFVSQLEEHGESGIAALFRADLEEYERRSEAGRQFFHGAHPEDASGVPDWLNSLFEVIAAGLTPETMMGPLGFRWREEEGFWEIDAYPTPVELVGGAADGAVVAPAFLLDLEQLRAVFEEVQELGWNALGLPDGDGPFIWVEGVYHGHDVFLRVLAQAPEGEEPGAKLRIPRRPER